MFLASAQCPLWDVEILAIFRNVSYWWWWPYWMEDGAVRCFSESPPPLLLPSTIHAKSGLNWPSGFREDKNDECHWMAKAKKEGEARLHHSLDLPIINDLNKYFLLNSVIHFMECRLINTITSLMLIVNKKQQQQI